jgi:hypothetical protein
LTQSRPRADNLASSLFDLDDEIDANSPSKRFIEHPAAMLVYTNPH